MNEIKLTISMACADDYDGVYFSLQALRLYHDLTHVELLVIDNKPESSGSAILKRQIESDFQLGCAGARYLAMPDSVGCAQPRNRAVTEARGKAFCNIDCHVFLVPGAVEKLIEYFDRNPDCQDLITGPLVYDNLHSISTHFADVWRAEMWGVWSLAWKMPDGSHVSAIEENGRLRLYTLVGHQPIGFDDIPWENHEPKLHEKGLRPLGYDDTAFEVPGQGCGLFAGIKKHWLGFNTDFRGFGGEEMYINRKYQNAGCKTVCLGFLKWMHRFERPRGVPYRLTRFDKVRNYVLGANELNLPLQPIYDHFVATELMPLAEWDLLTSDPIRLDLAHFSEAIAKTMVNGQAILPSDTSVAARKPLARHFDDIKALKEKSYFSDHMDAIRSLSAKCEYVEEISRYSDTSIALLAGQPKRLRSHIFDNNASIYSELPAIAGETELIQEFVTGYEKGKIEISDCDMLLYKTPHAWRHLAEELTAWSPKIKRFIVLHDTARNADKLDDGGPGYGEQMFNFVDTNPDWYVHSHNLANCGLTVLGKQEIDRPKEKQYAWIPAEGPGAELAAMLKSIGVEAKAGCDCVGKQQRMNILGVEGCKAARDEIVGWMRDGSEKWGWKEKMAAATKAITSGLAFSLSLTDPWGSLIDESIRRAEIKEKEIDAKKAAIRAAKLQNV